MCRNRPDLSKQDHSNTRNSLAMMYSFVLYPSIDKTNTTRECSVALTDKVFPDELRHNIICGIPFNDIIDHLQVFFHYANELK